MKITITEALADIKTSLSRIEKKRAMVSQFLGRDSRLRDPHESIGGSAEWVRRERQAINDLEEKVVKIRSAIQTANLQIVVEVEGQVRTLSEWLNWRREISENRRKNLSHMVAQVNNLRQQAIRQGQEIRAAAGADVKPQGELIVNINETELVEEADKLERILGTLDGRLSLLNATNFIEV